MPAARAPFPTFDASRIRCTTWCNSQSWSSVPAASARWSKLGPFMEAFRTLLIVPSGQRTVPALITELSAGDSRRFLDMIDDSGPSLLADGAYLSIECTESTNRIDAAEIDAASANTFLGRYRVDEQLRACSVWPGTDGRNRSSNRS